MKVDLPMVQPVKARGRTYYYFRRTGMKSIKLPGHPGGREFQVAYEAALRLHAPEKIEQPRRAKGAGRGALAWVIEQFKLKSPQWKNATASTREVYDRRHHWLAKNYGTEQLVDFDRDVLKQMRDLPEFANKPSVADATIERFGTLWNFAEEFLHLDNMRVHKGINPARTSRRSKRAEARARRFGRSTYATQSKSIRTPIS
jgi:hypothetical protein